MQRTSQRRGFRRDRRRVLHSRPRGRSENFAVSLRSQEVEGQLSARGGGQQPLTRASGIPPIDRPNERENACQVLGVAVAKRATAGPEVHGATVNAKKPGKVLPCEPADLTEFTN
jgi:hypothetical protein